MKKEQINKILAEALKANGVNYSEEDSDEFSTLPDAIQETYYGWSGSNKTEHPDGFTLKIEEEFGGEGQGDDYWFVLSLTENFTKKKTHIRFNGWYASHHGHEFDDDDFDIVEPRTIEVIKWFSVK